MPRLSRRDQAAEFVLLGRGLARKTGRERFQVLETGSGVVEHDALVVLQKSVRQQFPERGDTSDTFGGSEDTLTSAELDRGIQQLGVADGYSRASTLAHRVQHQKITERFGHAEAARYRVSVLPERA